MQNARTKKAKSPYYQGGHYKNKQRSENLRWGNSSEEENKAEKWNRRGDQQEYISQPRNKLSREQREGRELRAQQQVIGLSLLLSINRGRGKRRRNKDDQEELYE